jgi:predicted NUDIX family NTP pyrophosphohydrolase
MAKISAGLLLWRRRDGQVEVLLGHPGGPFYTRKDDGVWTIPKGEHDEAEDPLAAAYREFAEELGAPAPAGEALPLGEARQSGGKTNAVWAVEGDFDASGVRSNTFSMEWPPRSGRQQEFPELDRAAWFELTAARTKIRPAQLPFLERLARICDAAPG